MANVKVTVANPQNLNDAEDQVYSNYGSLPLAAIKKSFEKTLVVAPEVGNFPHMGGNNKPVIIVSIEMTNDEDNAGIGISEVIRRYTEWGS